MLSTAHFRAGLLVAIALSTGVAVPSDAAAAPGPSAQCTNSASELLFAVYFADGPAVSLLPARFVAERKANVERMRGQSASTRARTLARLRRQLDDAGHSEDAALVGQLASLYERAAALGHEPRSDATISAATRATFVKAFEARFPGALAGFATAMRSKDPVAVRLAVRKTAARVLEVSRALGESAPTGASSEHLIVLDTAIHIALIVPVPLGISANGSALGEDQLVALLTAALGC